MGALDGFKRRIIVSDGGPGHFKVYKTQFWMSRWASSLRTQFQIVTEWNMYFANLGHNLCDGHAGKMKVYVLLDRLVCFLFVPLIRLAKFEKLKGIITRW
jgi:hypothetical protein